MKEAIGAYRNVSATDEFRELERIREKSRHNEAAALYNAEAKGKAEGKAEGRMEVARSMLADGLPPDVVSKYTGLSKEDILTLG